MIVKQELMRPYEGRIEPFRLFGNIYFAGAVEASCHIIDTGDGLIVIDTGYLRGLYLLVDNIYRLGFVPKDIKYIINTHWHWDHAEASGELAKLSGAKNLICHYDAENAKQYFTPDILIKDGDTLSLGNTTVYFLETPGHTRGTISLFFNVEENGKKYRAGMFGGAGTNTLSPENYEYDGCVDHYFASLERLRKEKVDIFIGNHVHNNNTVEKAEILRSTGENRFLDDTAWKKFLDGCERNINSTIQKYGRK